jgi:hypothetical protein
VVHQTSFLSDSKKTEERGRLEAQKESLDEKITLNKALTNRMPTRRSYANQKSGNQRDKRRL